MTNRGVPLAFLVFGARPNYMKIAPIYREMMYRGSFNPLLVDTGQHFSGAMSRDVAAALHMPDADIQLDIGPGSQGWQFAKVVEKLEPHLAKHKPDVVVVVGDVTSTLASAIAADSLEIAVAHVEAGLRSRDWGMPEERNRVLTDHLSTMLLTPSEDANQNLYSEGIEPSGVRLVGNVMIDSLEWIREQIDADDVRDRLRLPDGAYGLLTLHRPSNVDDPKTLTKLIAILERVGRDLPIVFPVHPRTAAQLRQINPVGLRSVDLRPPLAYDEFIAAICEASVVLTDSGGIQEEALILGVPCITLRSTTERPITVKCGGNRVLGADADAISVAVLDAINGNWGRMERPKLWDGHAAGRIAHELQSVSQLSKIRRRGFSRTVS